MGTYVYRPLSVTFLIIALVFTMAACASIAAMPQPSSRSVKPFPFSIRVELREVNLRMPPGWSWDQGSLKQSIVAYMQKRGSFREVVEGPSELVLALNVRFGISTGGGGTLMQGALGALSEGYDFTLDGQLVAGERVGADSPMLGSYAASGGADPGLGFGSPDATISRAMSQALDTFFQRIEQDREMLLAKLGKAPAPSAVSRAQDSPALPTSDVDSVPTVKAALKTNAHAVVIGIEQYREKLPKAEKPLCSPVSRRTKARSSSSLPRL